SLSRLSASSAAPRCAWCGGSKVPPNSPMRMPRAWGGSRRSGLKGTGSRTDLAASADAIFERGELFDADRPARVQAAGGDADLGAEAELAAVGKLRRGIMQHDGRVDLRQERLRSLGVIGDDGVGVVRAVA